MNLDIEIDNRNAELAVYESERLRMVRELAEWDAWGAAVAAKKAALEAQREALKRPAVVTPVEGSTAFGVLSIGEEEVS